MRRLLSVMTWAGTPQHPAIAVSLDAGKAFDRTEWKYLVFASSKYDFGPVCMKWVRALYHNPVSTVKPNGIRSDPFHQSTRQGCPASPVIFTLVLEPLACAT